MWKNKAADLSRNLDTANLPPITRGSDCGCRLLTTDQPLMIPLGRDLTMKSPLGFTIAVLATSSLAFASGDDDKKGGKKAKKADNTPAIFQGTWSGGAGR